MKKRALILLTLLATIAIGITAQKIGRQIEVNRGGKIVAIYELPEEIDSLTFSTFKIYTVTVNSDDESKGSVTASSTEIKQGNSVTLTATPKYGYQFASWTLNGEIVSTANPYTAKVTANSEYVANFKEKPNKITPISAECSEAPYQSYTIDKAIDGSYTTYYDSNPQQKDGTTVTTTLDGVYVLSEVKIYFKSNYLPTKAKIQVSTDGTTWTDVEGTEFAGADAIDASNVQSNAKLITVNCNGAIAKYVRMLITEKASTYLTIYEFEVYGEAYSLESRTISVSVNDEAMGTAYVGAEGVTEETSTGTIELVAVANEGYEFVNWTLNGEVVSTDANITDTTTGDKAYVANFELKTYCIKSGNSSHEERYLSTFTLTDGTSEAVVSDIQTGTGQALYHDKTSVVLETEAGATVSFSALPWNGEWMHGYVFLDYNNDYEFDATLNADGTTGGELVSYNFYSAGGASTGTNSKGETVSNDCGVKASNMPSWTLPSDLAPGDYRMRFNVAWNSIDPCGYAEIGENGGAMVDVTIRIASQAAARTISVSATPAEAGTVTINGEAVESVTAEGTIVLEATAAEGYIFVNWTLNGEEVATTAKFVDATEGDKVYVANFVEAYPYNGHEYVDLGLPSGIKWATCNVGANSPEEYGDYFAWGETEPKDYYYWSTYKYCNGSYNTMTKYCTNSDNGTVDNKTVLELEDDAARINWGGNWRMPTKAEQDELRDTNNCTWEWTTQNGVNGYKVTSKVNGNSIFLPAAGYRRFNDLSLAGDYGNYRSSSLGTYLSYDACYLDFHSSLVDWNSDYRFYGQSVRAVCE